MAPGSIMMIAKTNILAFISFLLPFPPAVKTHIPSFRDFYYFMIGGVAFRADRSKIR